MKAPTEEKKAVSGKNHGSDNDRSATDGRNKKRTKIVSEKFSAGEVVQTLWGVATVRRGWSDGDYDLNFPGYNEPFCCSEDQLIRLGDEGKSTPKRTNQRKSQTRTKKQRRRQSLFGHVWKHQARRNGRFLKETDEEVRDQKEEGEDGGDQLECGTRIGLEYQAAIPVLRFASSSESDQALGRKLYAPIIHVFLNLHLFVLCLGGTLVDSETVARPAVIPSGKLKRKTAQSIGLPSPSDSTTASNSISHPDFPVTLTMQHMLDPLSWLSHSNRSHFEYTLRPHADQKVPLLLSDLSTKSSPSSSTSASPMSSPFAGKDGLTLFVPPSLSPMSSSMPALFTAAGAPAASITLPTHSTGVPVTYAPSLSMYPEVDKIVSIDENGALMIGTLHQPFRFSFPDQGNSAGNNSFWAHNPYLHSWLYPQPGLEQSLLTID
jgi:hypothetical protein